MLFIKILLTIKHQQPNELVAELLNKVILRSIFQYIEWKSNTICTVASFQCVCIVTFNVSFQFTRDEDISKEDV